jgi:hypothetical protein
MLMDSDKIDTPKKDWPMINTPPNPPRQGKEKCPSYQRGEENDKRDGGLLII